MNIYIYSEEYLFTYLKLEIRVVCREFLEMVKIGKI